MSKAVGNRLKYYRALRGLSMRRLQKKSGVAEKTICYIEAGITTPHAGTLSKLARALDAPLEEFLSPPKEQ